MILLHNKSARFHYDTLETYEAGIKLIGSEVKSLRQKRGRIDDSFITISSDNKIIMRKFLIQNYQLNNSFASFHTERDKMLLLSRKEILKLEQIIHEPGITLIPLSVYTKGRFIKVEIGVVRGRKKYDKRNVLKKRDAVRDFARDFKMNLK